MIKINRKILSIYKTNRGKPDESGLCNGNIDMSICRQILITRINKSFKLIITPGEERIRQLNLYHIKKNLFNGEYEKGYIKGTDINLHGTSSNKYRTTGWFPVNASQGRSLVLSGTAHNRSAWQFMRADRTILAAGEAKRKYNIVKDVLQDKTVSKVDIPSDAVYARVFYASYDDGAELDDRLQIEYGKLPTYYQPYHSEGFELPDLGKDESIEYRNGVWTLVSKKGKRVLDMQELTLEVGDTIILDSNTCEINIYVTNETDITNMSIKGITNRTNEPNEINKTNKTNESNEANEPNEINKSNEPNEINKTHMGIYGVRWDMNSRYPVCERIQDAKGFTFNCIYGSNYMTPYENSFDSVYPWSDIRLCNIRFSKKGKMRIIYSDEEEFHTECSKGNIFVEIPKFYCKREQIDGYEYLLISGTEQEGFIIDPSFETANGIIDHIYIGAYLSSFRKKKLRSVSNSFPLIRKSLQSIRNLALNSYGIAEVDLLAILTVQKLYIVETAILDSQSIFTGLVHLPYLLKDRQTPLYSLTNESSTNRIRVKESVTTRRFCVGDAVSILQNWKEYRNKPLICQREITDIKSDGKTLEITFSGEPVDIIKRQSGITCIPYKTVRRIILNM
jgi:hypothetical protein